MKLNPVAITSSSIPKAIEFYTILGFSFRPCKKDEQHVDSIPNEGSIRLMIDSKELTRELIGKEPKPGNHSNFAIQYDSPQELNNIAEKIKLAGFTISKEPWDAFWGQRYAIVVDPDGYYIDLYASL